MCSRVIAKLPSGEASRPADGGMKREEIKGAFNCLALMGQFSPVLAKHSNPNRIHWPYGRPLGESSSRFPMKCSSPLGRITQKNRPKSACP